MDKNSKKEITATCNVSSGLTDTKVKDMEEWKRMMLKYIRTLIKQSDPEIIEEIKWVKPTNPAGTIVWSDNGGICTGEVYKNVVKLTFFKGAALKDPKKIFNSCLEGNARRAIDFHEGDKVNEDAFKTLIQAAATLNKQKV